MKNIKKALVVLLASMFVGSVFADDATAPAADAKAPAADTAKAPAKAVKKHHKKHKKAPVTKAEKADATTPAAQAPAQKA